MRELRLVFGAGRNQSNLTMAVTGNLERASGGGHAVVVMAKAPLAGAVKSRLAPPLGAEEAAELNRCFLRDLSATIERAIAIFASAHGGRAAGLIAYAPAGAESAFDGVTPPAFRLIAQRGENLTARLIGVCEDLFAAGHASVTLMNSDSPTLPARILVSALTAMSRAADRIAIGGADDGGYCLIGLKQTHRRIFEQITWSTALVYRETLERAAELGLEVAELERWYDVDDAAALRRLEAELFGQDARVRRGDPAPATRAYLEFLRAKRRAGESGSKFE
jgi:rSAM/selenodomain-associated transferase 1